MTQSIEEALAFIPPSLEEVEKKGRWLKRYFDPVFMGVENIESKKPTLFAGNHTRFAVLDSDLLINGIYSESGIFPRGLADRLHYKVPFWKDRIGDRGAVEGTREMCRALMKAKESLLVFPGGAREVSKGKGTNYKLLWQERLGFVRMAVEHGYSITPFASVGADHAYDVLADGDDLMNSYAGTLIKQLGLAHHTRKGELLPPITRGIGLTMFPRPEKFYFSFAKPIQTRQFKGQQDDKEVLYEIQQKVAAAVNNLMADSLLLREQEHDKLPLLRRVLQKL